MSNFDSGSRGGTVSDRSSVHVEALESRTLMSANFSWVGVDFSAGGASVQLGTAVLGDDLTVTGTATVATPGQTLLNQAIDVASMQFGASGTMSITRAAGLAPFVTQSGTEFRTTGADYSLGVHRGSYDDGIGGAGEITRFLIERRDVFSSIRPVSNYIAVRTIEITADGVRYDQDIFKIYSNTNGEPTSIWHSEDGLPTGAVFKPVTSWTHDGVVRFGNNETLIFGRRALGATAEEFALYFDADASDGKVSIGTAFAQASKNDAVFPNAANPLAVYRGSILSNSAGARAFLGITDEAAQGIDVVITLASDKTYALYVASEYDAGGAAAISSGTWASKVNDRFTPVPPETVEVLVNSVRLKDTRGQTLIMATSNAFNLVPEIFYDGNVQDRLGGQLATKGRLISQSFFKLAPQSLQIDEAGNLFLLGAGGPSGSDLVWRRFDMGNVLAGKPIASAELFAHPASIYAWDIVAIARDGDVLTYQFESLAVNTTEFVMTNLTQTTSSALFGVKFAPGAAITSTIYSTVQFHGGPYTYSSLTIAGRSTAGDLLYVSGIVESHTPNSHDDEQLVVVNVSSELRGVGEIVPDSPGPFFAYETYWNAQNILFLNGQGQVVTVWTAPGLNRWYVNNLSEIAGAVPLVGQLSTLVTSWRGIHIHGLDADGNLHVVWWAPALIGEWKDSNLTGDLHGTALATSDSSLRASTLATWLGYTGDMHIMAIDEGGNSRLYWWSLSTLTWQIVNVTPDVNASTRATLLIGQARSVAPQANLVFGQNIDHELVRLYSNVGEAGPWTSENVTISLV